MKIFQQTTTRDAADFVNRFCGLPDTVRRDPYRLGMLPASIERCFLTMACAGPKAFWIAEENGVTLGRIGANVSGRDGGTGFIGFLEFDADAPGGRVAASELINVARSFLHRHGVQRIVAPVQINTWFPYRYRLSEEDGRFFAWEPVHPPAYREAFEEAGFSIDTIYHSAAYGRLDRLLDMMMPAYATAVAAGYRFRPFDRLNWPGAEVPLLHRISRQAFADNHLYEPISLDVFRNLYVDIADKRCQHSRVVLTAEGEAVGFLFGFLDRHRPDDDSPEECYFVIKSLAVLERERGRGLSNALVYAAMQEAAKAGARYGVSALVRTGIRSESIEKKGELFWRHRYGLLKSK